MRKKYFLFFIILVLLTAFHKYPLYAQLPDANKPEVPAVKDVLTHEDALILSTTCDIELKSNWKWESKITRKIKLYSEKACQMYGEIPVGYLPNLQKVLEFKGSTILPNGRKFVAKKINDYMPQKDMSVFGGYSLKVLSMPGLEKDCEMEYSYKLKSDDLGLYGLFNDFFVITETIPIKYARFSIELPRDVSLHYFTNNIPGEPTIKKMGSKKKYIWEVKDVERLKFEEYLPPYKSFTTWIAVSTSDSWEDYINSWADIYKMKSAVNPKLKKVTKELIEGAETNFEKAKRIFNYVQNKIRYLAIEFGRAGWIPFTATKVFKDKAGDCKGKTVLIMAMLRSTGIEAYPAMLSSRASGPILTRFCDETQFSHIIPVCIIDNKLVWMDPSSQSSFGTLPYHYQGVDALVVKKNEGGFFRTPVSEATDNVNEALTQVILNADGSAEGTVSIKGIGSNADLYRSYMNTMTPEMRDQFFQTLVNNAISTATTKRYDYSDYTNSNNPMEINLDFTAKKCAERINDLLVIDALSQSGPRYTFLKDERFYDIELNVKECDYDIEKIVIPDGFIFDTVPKDYKKETPYLNVSVTYKINGNVLTRDIRSEWPQLTIPKNEYQTVKTILDDFYTHANRKIILRKVR